MCALLGAAASATACGGGAGGQSPAPLPSLLRARPSPAPAEGRAWAGVIGYTDIGFRAGPGQDVDLRVVGAQWRESVLASDGTIHELVLAVALRVTCGERAVGPLRLSSYCELTLSDGTIRRSGQFTVAGGLRAVRPGEQRWGWIVFENVDWDVLRGNSQPPESRFRVHLMVGDGQSGTGEWMVDAWGLQKGGVRRVGVSVLEASVNYMVM